MSSILDAMPGAAPAALCWPSRSRRRRARATDVRTSLPPITVTAQKEPEDPHRSGQRHRRDRRDAGGGRRRAASATPAGSRRTRSSTSSRARKLSNARFRGVGSSPSNPGVTTYIDGVPQLNANSSSLELIDIDQIEFVRGPQSALFGRNALGGVINITSRRPSLQQLVRRRWSRPSATSESADVRGTASGPDDRRQAGGRRRRRLLAARRLHDERRHRQRPRLAIGRVRQGASAVAAGATVGSARRCSRSSARATATTRSTTSRRCARTPFHASRDVEGFTHRDIVAPTFHVTHAGRRDRLLVHHRLPEVEDRRSHRSRLHRRAARHAQQRRRGLSVHGGSAVRVREGARRSRCRTRVSAEMAGRRCSCSRRTTAGRGQQLLAVRAVAVRARFRSSQHSPQSTLDDRGVGVYGQGTFTVAGDARPHRRRARRSRAQGRAT